MGRKGILQSSVEKGFKMTRAIVGVVGEPMPKETFKVTLDLITGSSTVLIIGTHRAVYAIPVVVVTSSLENLGNG